MELLLNLNGRYKYRSFQFNSEYTQIHPVELDRALAAQAVSGKLKLSNSANLKVSTYSSVFSSELHILRSFL